VEGWSPGVLECSGDLLLDVWPSCIFHDGAQKAVADVDKVLVSVQV
jgi:hypothetical protein